MLEFVIGTSIVVLGQLVAGIVWGVRQEGKINLQEQRTTDLKELINTRFDATDERLKRIESGVNGKSRHD